MRNSLRLSNERGAALVEAGLVITILLLLIFGIVDFGRAFNTKQVLTHASREAVRVYVVTESQAAGIGAFNDASTGLGSGTTVNVPSDGCTNGAPVTVTASTTFDFVMLPIGSIDLNAQAVMRCGG